MAQGSDGDGLSLIVVDQRAIDIEQDDHAPDKVSRSRRVDSCVTHALRFARLYAPNPHASQYVWIVNQPVESSIGQCGIADLFVPT